MGTFHLSSYGYRYSVYVPTFMLFVIIGWIYPCDPGQPCGAAAGRGRELEENPHYYPQVNFLIK
jgi:hypothetical protein